MDAKDLKPNSHKFKEQNKEKDDKPRLSQVTNNHVKIEKKSAFEHIKSSFITTDAKTIKDYIIDDFMIPAIKKGILEVINMIFYNTPNSKNSQGYNSPKIAYGGFVNGQHNLSSKTVTKRNPGFNFDKFVFQTRGDAESVLAMLQGAIDQYGTVSVLDLYDVAGVTTDMVDTYDKYGWTDLSHADILRGSTGYYLKLPDVRPI